MHRIKSKISLNLLRTSSQINHKTIWKFCYFEEKDSGIQHYIVQNEEYFKVK